MAIDTLGIIGVGLIGGSLGLAARMRNAARRVVGYSPEDEREQVHASGAVDELLPRWVDVAEASDVVVLATPPEVTLRLLPEVALRTNGIISDVCSVKGPVVEAAKFIERPERFVGAHPMAGSHQRGAAWCRSDLFDGRTIVVTPTDVTEVAATTTIMTLWREVGGEIIRLSSHQHDWAAARVSHGVHALAAVAVALSMDDDASRALASTGFGDTTRVASGDPEMWAEILTLNAADMVDVLGEAERAIADLRQWLEAGDRGSIRDWLERVRASREAWLREHMRKGI